MKTEMRRGNQRKIQNLHFRFSIWAILLFLSACHTVPPLASVDFSTGDWSVQQGQAVWKSNQDAPELAGDLLVAVNPKSGRAVVQFTKTPIPFVIAQTTPASWQIEIPVQKKFYSGRGKPPGRLAWFYLPDLLKGTPPPKNWTFEKNGDNWRMENKRSGETIEGFLSK